MAGPANKQGRIIADNICGFDSHYLGSQSGSVIKVFDMTAATTLFFCQSCLRSYIVSRILEGNGYETYNFSSGFRFYDAVTNERELIETAYACGMDK